MATASTNCKLCRKKIEVKGRTPETAETNLAQAVREHYDNTHRRKPQPRVPELEALAEGD